MRHCRSHTSCVRCRFLHTTAIEPINVDIVPIRALCPPGWSRSAHCRRLNPSTRRVTDRASSSRGVRAVRPLHLGHADEVAQAPPSISTKPSHAAGRHTLAAGRHTLGTGRHALAAGRSSPQLSAHASPQRDIPTKLGSLHDLN